MKFVWIPLGIALTVCCWGMYGPVLHQGQEHLGNSKLKPLICVGLSYLAIAVVVPTVILFSRGEFWGGWWDAGPSGITWSMLAGLAGVAGAFGIIIAMTSGGKPIYVMPIVFGCAPVVTVLFSMYFAGLSWRDVNPIFIAGLLLVSVGAATVLIFQPKSPKRSHDEEPAASQKSDDAKAASALAKAD